MTLLQDLESLDLTEIIEARDSIRRAVERPELQAILSGGAAQTALADLGSSLQTLRDTADEPAALLRPLVDAVADLAGSISLDDVPVDQYLEAVREGASLMARLFEGLDGDPATFGQFLGLSLGEALDRAQSVIGSYTQAGLEDLTQFRDLVDTVERGVPTDPAAFADLAVDVLLPFPRASLTEMRHGLVQILDGSSAIALPPGRTDGLKVALDAVASAAATADARALERALRDLERARVNTITSIQNDFLNISADIGQLHVEEGLRAVADASRALETAEEGVLEYLANWREQIAVARTHIENLDPGQISPLLPALVQHLEEFAQTQIAESIDAQVHHLEEWVRGLLAHLPVRSLRAELSRFIHSVAQAIEDADLDRYARDVRELLDEIQSSLDPGTLTADIRETLEGVERVISDALDDVIEALNTVKDAIESVTEEAEEVLNRAADALARFKAAIDEITAAVDNLGVEQAAQQVVDTLTRLRETAEELLSVAPLPEPLRPLVEQLIDALESVDFDVVLNPARAAVAEFDIPDEVSATLTEALQKTRDVLQNLIPAELIRSIEAEIDTALNVIRDFDPATLLGGVTDFIDDAADLIVRLDPRPLAQQVRGPYQAVLDAIDAAHPNVLLAPVIQAYDSLLGDLSVPAPETAVRRMTETIGATGESMARTAIEPVRRLAPPGAVELPEPGATSPPPPLPQPDDIRPGDIIRIFGYLPNQLREALAALEDGPAGEALRAVDALCGGLARDLRRVQAALWDIEARVNGGLDELLAPLGTAQTQAQLAIQANFSAGTVDVDAAMLVVAQSGPGSLRSALVDAIELVGTRAHTAASDVGGPVGAALERAAIALERCRLSGLGSDLDAFLAALDTEPIAAEFDGLVAAALRRAPGLMTEMADELQALMEQLKALIRRFNPGAQAQKFLVVLDVLRQELEVLNPRRLAAELGEVHAAIRETIVAYDPTDFAAEVAETLMATANLLRSLDPAALLGDLSFLDSILDRVENAVPTDTLADVGESLAAVGQRLADIDPAGLLDAVERLGPKLVEAFEKTIEAIRREIITLLESLRYASASASVTVGGG